MESNDSPEIPDRGETADIPGLPSGSMIKTIITIAIIAAYRGENNIKCLRKHKTTTNKVSGRGGGGDVKREQNN